MDDTNILEVLLTEYDSLRDELKKNFDIQITLYGILIPALGVAYGLILQYGLFDLVLLLPFIFLPLGLRFQHSNYGVKIIGEHLEELEKQIQNLLGYDNWEGFQNYWQRRHVKKIVFIYDALAKGLLFIVIPFGIAILYLIHKSLPFIFIDVTNNSFINPNAYPTLSAIYILILGFSLIAVWLINYFDEKKKLSLEKGKKVIVFQYGSNCLEERINSSDRLNGAAKFYDVAKTIGDYQLTFDKLSNKNEHGVADIVKLNGKKVWGVLYEIPENLLSRETCPQNKRSLDAIEDEGRNYSRYWLPVERPNGQKLIALTYIVKEPDDNNVRTSKEYAKYILDGLKEHLKKPLKKGIPKEYLEEVKNIIRANNPEIDPAIFR